MSIPNLDEQFLPRIVSVFYAVFHPTEGPKVIYQVPEGSITQEEEPPRASTSASHGPAQRTTQHGGMLSGDPLFNFSALSEYLIPKAPLCGRLVTSIARGAVRRPRQSGSPLLGDEEKAEEEQLPLLKTYKILGFPTLIEDATRYQRNNFIFNLCFVFDGHADVRAYEPVVRKCGRMLRSLEESQSFLSSPRSLPRMYAIIEQLFEDLNSYCESFVALPEAPHTSYLQPGSKHNTPELQKLVSPVIRSDDFVSLGQSFATLRDEHHRKLINEHLKLTQMQKRPVGGRQASDATTNSGDSELGGIASPELRGEPSMIRSNSSTGTSGPASDSPHSSDSPQDPFASGAPRPGLHRSSTVITAASPLTEGKDTVMGTMTSRGPRVSRAELNATDTPGKVFEQRDAACFDSVNSHLGTSKTSRGNLRGHPDRTNTSLEQLTESIVSLRTIDAALSNSVNSLRNESTDQATRASFAERREPPHGLGRTVRDAINLKLFPVYANPPPVNDWDVPVALLDLSSRVDGNWDLTMRRVLPYINGVTHVKRIAQLADADLGLTRACLEHLIYYGCIIVVDIFQYFNMYTVRPAIAKMADDEAMGRECAAYVTRSGYAMPTYPELLRLYSLLRAGKTLHDWIEENEVDAKGIDVRRFVSFGIIQGFLRRVHRYPVFLDRGTSEDADSSKADNSIPSTLRSSPSVQAKADGSGRMLKSQQGSTQRRDQSGSREPRDRRPRELSGMSGAYSAFQRVTRDGSIDGPRVGPRNSVRRTTSEMKMNSKVTPGASGITAGSSHITESTETVAGTSNFGTSPTKRMPRPRQKQLYRHPTATANDVASVAFEVGDDDGRGAMSATQTTARSPRKRSSAIGTGSNAASSGFAHAQSGTSGISQRSTLSIPHGLIDLLDGTHHDDELCVAFSLSWPELERLLVYMGTAKDGSGGRYGLGLHGESEEDDPAFSQNRSDWRRLHSGTGQSIAGTGTEGAGASSGWSKSRHSGFSGMGGQIASQGGSTGPPSSARIGAHAGGESSIHLAGASGFNIGLAWGVEPDESGVAPGWSGFSGPDRQAIEAGDLGRIRILLQ